ncbi:MAG: Rpn family recombination-promoting nuclease/putative transposase [Geobacter sp.]|nr:Rpn family recombination-promoting nuclease/putative transposase [Geobacter sp.]
MKNQLVRFDWAMKKLLRNKANFEILEGFLSELLKQDVRIESILESESNKNSLADKQNRVDLLTQVGSGELVLIELQVEAQYDYFHRMVYGTSKLITDNMDSGSSYEMVRKVISINIVYFDLGHGQDYVYHGTTDFRGTHTNDILRLSASQQNQIRNHTLAPESSCEYYVLKVFNFNDCVQDTLDEWMYFFKNCKIKSEFSAKGLHKAAEELDLLKLSPEERGAYYNYIEDRRVIESSVKTAWLEGKHKGLEESKLEGKLEIALEMIKDGESNDKVRKYTGLTDDEIDGLRKTG